METASAPGIMSEIIRADYGCSSFDGFLFGPGFDSPHLHIRSRLGNSGWLLHFGNRHVFVVR